MKEHQIFLGTSVFPMAWILRNSPACMPKWSKDYEIKKNKSCDLKKTLITLNKNALIHLARLIDNPDSFADNLMTSIFRLKFNNLAPFEKHILWRHGPRNVTWCLGWIFHHYILARYVLSYLCGTLNLDPSASLKRLFAFSVGVLFSLSTHALTCVHLIAAFCLGC